MRRIWYRLRAPFDDYIAALEACSRDRRTLWLVAPAAVLSWWIYVPLHELLHAYGCLWTGGEVTRLEIDAVYGAGFLQRYFPFVAVGSEYAGQLTGFETHGSDWIYLATDALPFVLTILIGVPLLRRAATSPPLPAALALGVALPIAFAPFLSLTGDYFEMGSILASRALFFVDPATDVTRWRSDDLFKLIGERLEPGPLDVIVVASSVLIALLLAWLTYGAGAFVSNRLTRRSVTTDPPSPDLAETAG